MNSYQNELLKLNGHIVGGAFPGCAPSFVVDLGGGHMAVAEELLDLTDIDACIQQEGGGGGAQGMGAVEP